MLLPDSTPKEVVGLTERYDSPEGVERERYHLQRVNYGGNSLQRTIPRPHVASLISPPPLLFKHNLDDDDNNDDDDENDEY